MVNCYGVSVSGAMDRLGLVIANRLVNNPDMAAALEITIVGPELLLKTPRSSRSLARSVAGRDGHSVPIWTTVAIQAEAA